MVDFSLLWQHTYCLKSLMKIDLPYRKTNI